MKKFLVTTCFIASAIGCRAQFYSIETNLLGWATTNLNAEVGVSVHRNWSLHLPVNYNPFVFPKNKRMQNLTVTPGVRYWFLETFSQGFIGMHIVGSRFHAGGIGKKYRYDGYGVGMGVSYGYSKVLNKRWNIEFEGGIGLIWADYTKYLCKRCGIPLGKERKPYLIPSKASVSLVYLF